MYDLDSLRRRVRKLARNLPADPEPYVILTTAEDGSESAAFVGWADRPCLSGAEAAAWWEARCAQT
ncbi:MAG TPA: hypothetical protein DCY80_03235 [Solibacterales bacterium]|nr:hypothetical protein [Bryobacterales bacterium]